MYKMKSKISNFNEGMLNGLFISVLCLLPIAWIIRDGLGPGSVESTGYEAIIDTILTSVGVKWDQKVNTQEYYRVGLE